MQSGSHHSVLRSYRHPGATASRVLISTKDSFPQKELPMSQDYHKRELATALNPSDPKRSMPPISPEKHKCVLDVGCGMGQTLLAAELDYDIWAFGVDADRQAVMSGPTALQLPSNIHLFHAGGEVLPFEDETFDLVFSRISLPYMNIDKALSEIVRVLKPGGEVWFALHSASAVIVRSWTLVCQGKPRKALACAYVLANGILFNWFGVQVALRGHQETFQTYGGIRRAMIRAGLSCERIPSKGLLVQGKKV